MTLTESLLQLWIVFLCASGKAASDRDVREIRMKPTRTSFAVMAAGALLAMSGAQAAEQAPTRAISFVGRLCPANIHVDRS